MPEIDAHKTRCFGNGAGHEILAAYHDTEWGVPVHDDRLLFEMLTLEGAQAGLNWEIVLKKRAGYKEAFHDFDLHQDKIERFIEKLLLPLVHIHANNWGLILGKNSLPEVLEMTFSRNAKQEEKHILPHPLDMPNNPLVEEIRLMFDIKV